MKLWEVIKALTEDSTKEFEITQHGRTETLTVGHGYLNYSQHAGHKLVDDVYVNDNSWQLVRQPVTWQEAIQAWADGKVVYVENKAGGRVYRYGGESEKMYLLTSEITEGTWYVED